MSFLPQSFLDKKLLKNYILNSKCENSSTTGWALYEDAAGVAPVDGTGVVTSNEATFASNTSSPLHAPADFKLTKVTGSSQQGEGVSYSFSIDSADQAKVLRISFDYKTADVSGTALVDGDVRIFIYDVTNAQLIEPSQRDLLVNSNGTYIGEFQSNSNSTSYRLIFHIAQAVSASQWTLNFDNVSVGPREIARGSVVSDWTSYTPTLTNITIGNGSTVFKQRRVGDSMEIEGAILFGSTTSVGGDMGINIPSGFSVDTSKINSADGSTFGQIGWCSAYDAGGTTIRELGYVTMDGSSLVRFYLSSRNDAGTSDDWSATFPFTWATTDQVYVHIKVPIVGWSANSNISSDFGGRVIALRAERDGSAQSVSGDTSAKTVIYNSVSTSFGGDTVAGLDTSTGIYTIKESGWYKASAGVVLTGCTSADPIDLNIVANSTVVASITNYDAQTARVMNLESGALKLVAGDTLKVTVDPVTDGTYDIADNTSTRFSIEKVQSPQTLVGSETVVATFTGSDTTSINSGGANERRLGQTGTETIDTHGALSSGIFTCPFTGYYVVTAGCALSPVTSDSGISLRFKKNGTQIYGVTNTVILDGVENEYNGVQGSCPPISCNAGDTLEVYVYHDNGGSTARNMSADYGSSAHSTLQYVGFHKL